MRILYVEDDDTMAMTVQRMLENAGHVCDRAALGMHAVKLGSDYEYDVILLDIMLPDLDGYEVAQRLRAGGVLTPVVIQSGLVERLNVRDGLGFGVEDYLVKPFNRAELLAKIDEAVTRAGSGPIGETLVNDGTSGQVLVGSTGSETHGCTIVSLSERGAAIELDGGLKIPPSFVLRSATGQTHRCETCWSFRNKVGAIFV